MIVAETQADRINELAVIQNFCKHMKCDYCKLPKFDIDFLLTRNGKGVAFAEVKCRPQKYADFKTQILSFIKFSEFVKVSKWLPCYFICRYEDGDYFIDVNNIPLDKIEYGGRKKPRPNFANDNEFLIHFDRTLMTKVPDKNNEL